MNPYQPPTETPKFVCEKCEAREARLREPDTLLSYLKVVAIIFCVYLGCWLTVAGLKAAGYQIWILRPVPGSNTKQVMEL